jgi:outer membrane protein assembly factor BamB
MRPQGDEKTDARFDLVSSTGVRWRAAAGFAVLALFAGGCSGGGSSPSPAVRPSSTPAAGPTGNGPTATPSPKPSASAVPTATPSPSPTLAAGVRFDWPTYGYNAQRTGESPDTTITSANVGSLRLAWSHQSLGNEFNLETQPILATNVLVGGTPHDVLYIGGGSGNVYAFDAQTGTQIWNKRLPPGSYTCGTGAGPFGVQGTFALDKANGVVYVPDGVHKIHAMDLATGDDHWSVEAVAPGTDDGNDNELRVFVHTGLNLVGGKLYLGTSGVCDITPWRGRVAVIDVNTHTLANTFYTVFNSAPLGVSVGQYSGGGVWGWGGVAVEPDGSAVYTGVGNADESAQNPPFVPAPAESAGYAEHILKLTGDLASAADSHLPSSIDPPNPPNATDIDLAGTPILFQPPGCPPLLAVQGKEGFLFVYDRTNLSKGPIAASQFSVSSDTAYYMGLPAYSIQTGSLYAAVSTGSPVAGSPGLAILKLNAGCSGLSLVAQPAFGPDSTDGALLNENARSSPTVVNDVVFLGTPNGVLWARDAKTGAALWDSASSGILTPNNSPGDEIRFGPVVSGGWVYFVTTESAAIYALTVNPPTTSSTLRRGALSTLNRPLPAALVRRPHRLRHTF